MPNKAPPLDFQGSPAKWSLPSGTPLSRVHSLDFAVDEFNPRIADEHWGGGRFDATQEDTYSYIYAASDDATAVCETLLRDLPSDDRGSRLLVKASVRSRCIGWLATEEDMNIVSLRSGADLGAISQDTWLVQAPSSEYGFTRRWAHQIRAWAPWASGFAWHSRLEPEGLAYIFFGDRCGAQPFRVLDYDDVPLPPSDRRLDTGPGNVYLRSILQRYRVALAP
jgi:hypothetical protein